VADRYRVGSTRVNGSSFVGSAFALAGEARIVLRGEIDSDALERLSGHLDGFIAARTRFITVDATGVTGADPRIVEILGETQRRLAPRWGLLSIVGLHPHLLHRHVLDPDAAPGEDPFARCTPGQATPPVLGPVR
jgi:hypothetical protein